MKKEILLSSMILAGGFGFTQEEDSVSLGMGYANRSYYSFADGEVANVDNTAWDLAFDVSSFGATIRLNGIQQDLYLYDGDTADFATLDTAGLYSWDSYINGNESWWDGALNKGGDPDDAADLGWGIYNSTTHHINGENLYVLESADGEFKKLIINKLASGTYSFHYANLDNSGEEFKTIAKSDYSGKNFAYFDLSAGEEIDLDPPKTDWDILFINYAEELAPGYIGGVTGAFSNVDVNVAEITDVPEDEADHTTGTFSPNLSEIGYDWKTFDFPTFSYFIEDSMTYFIQTVEGDVWKVFFTHFGGSMTGKIKFNKEQVAFAGVVENWEESLAIFPNPANDHLNIISANNDLASAEIYTTAGRVVYTIAIDGATTQIQTDALPNGMYVLKLTSNSGESRTEIISVNH
ncbi:MAG: T9SS type A sorting domain-containing protein [Flavobacteriales bacterium]|nr:T9SS type A sorting domain-containing protein [Flavobacteriales bacterium]